MWWWDAHPVNFIVIIGAWRCIIHTDLFILTIWRPQRPGRVDQTGPPSFFHHAMCVRRASSLLSQALNTPLGTSAWTQPHMYPHHPPYLSDILLEFAIASSPPPQPAAPATIDSIISISIMTLITHLSDIMILSGPLVFLVQPQPLTIHQKQTPCAWTSVVWWLRRVKAKCRLTLCTSPRI